MTTLHSKGPDHSKAPDIDADAHARRAFASLRVHAIFGTGKWESLTVDEAVLIQKTVETDLRPVFVLDRCSVDEDVLDVDIIDIRVHLVLAAAAGNVAAEDFSAYSRHLFREGLGLSEAEGSFARLAAGANASTYGPSAEPEHMWLVSDSDHPDEVARAALAVTDR